jgi:hypothetical protein
MVDVFTSGPADQPATMPTERVEVDERDALSLRLNWTA